MTAASLNVHSAAVKAFDVERVRADFPILQQQVNGHPLVYLDNAATTQKPDAVIDAISDYYRCDNSNVHRGAHALSDRATMQFEAARETTARFLNSPEPCQIIWVRGVTEGINLVANSWGRTNLKAGDKVLVSLLEHHSDIVPWQMVCAERGAEVVPIPVLDSGDIDLDALDALLDERVKMVAVNHVSNALGTVNPVAEIIKKPMLSALRFCSTVLRQWLTTRSMCRPWTATFILSRVTSFLARQELVCSGARKIYSMPCHLFSVAAK